MLIDRVQQRRACEVVIDEPIRPHDDISGSYYLQGIKSLKACVYYKWFDRGWMLV